MLEYSSRLFPNREKRSIINVLMILIIIALGIFIVHCSDQSGTRSQDNKEIGDAINNVFKNKPTDILIRELSSDPQYLNPVLSNDTTSSRIEALIFNGMINIDGSDNSNFVGRLAEKWSITDDHLTITFFLRKGITWQDGEPFTAEDVKFTFDMAARDDVPAFGMKSIVATIADIKILDPHTIQFKFKYPYAPSLAFVGSTFIIPKHRLDKQGLAKETERRGLEKPVTFVTSDFSRNPIGTGAYKFVEWKSNQQISLIENENYWDQDSYPKIKHVQFKIIPNRAVAFNILKKGDLDVFRARAIQYHQFLRSEELKKHYVAEAFFQPNYYYLGWNNRSENKLFSDPRIRMAMTHAMDREAFIDKIVYGLGEIITGPFYVKSWAYNHELPIIPYDLEKASDLLREAGWSDSDRDGVLDKDGIKFEFELLLSSGSPTFAQLAGIIQANLKKLSINVNINQYEWSVFLERIRKGEFDAYLGGWSLGIDPDPYNIWHSDSIGVGNNYIGYKNAKVDELLDRGRREFDREKRQKIYAQVHKLIYNDQPYTFIFSTKETYILSNRIKNYHISPFGLFEFYPGQLSWSIE